MKPRKCIDLNIIQFANIIESMEVLKYWKLSKLPSELPREINEESESDEGLSDKRILFLLSAFSSIVGKDCAVEVARLFFNSSLCCFLIDIIFITARSL